jgi:hypothetical protein
MSGPPELVEVCVSLARAKGHNFTRQEIEMRLGFALATYLDFNKPISRQISDQVSSLVTKHFEDNLETSIRELTGRYFDAPKVPRDD